MLVSCWVLPPSVSRLSTALILPPLPHPRRCLQGEFDYLPHDEDADAAAKKIQVLEHVDAELPRLFELQPTVLAITGDPSTPAPMAGHSWHPVPLLLHGPNCFVDGCQEFTETAAVAGHIGLMPALDLMGLMLANAGRLAKFGA